MKSLNGTAGGNRGDRESQRLIPPPPPPPELSERKRPNRNGSTIVGVLAALVFIGIVVAAMVKNTGAQSAASLGYGSAMVMSSTVQSGIVATEAFMQNVKNSTKAVATIQNYIDFNTGKTSDPTKKEPYVFGSSGTKEKLADGQYFRSRLISYDKINKRAAFEIESGKNEKGKSLRKTQVFYSVENVKMSGGGDWPGNSTMALSGGLSNGDNGFTIHGYSTFEKGFTSQNGKPMKFLPDANGKGDVFFNSKVEFMNPSVKFEVPAYFNSDVQFQNLTDNFIFKNDVGFNGNFAATDGNTYSFGGNIWINGDIRTPPNASGNLGSLQSKLKIKSVAEEQKSFNYTNRLTGLTGCHQPPCVMTIVGNSWTCDVHSGSHTTDNRVNLNTNLIDFNHTNKVNTSTSPYNIVTDNLKINNLATRKQIEPNIDLTKIPADIIKSSSSVFTNGTFDVDKITEKLGTAQSSELYNGHLVISIDNTLNYNTDNTTKTFEGKVILIVESGVTVNMDEKFYNSSSSASTLIYAKPGATLKIGFNPNNTSNKLFRGLIYTDPLNTQNHEFKWTPNTSIQGAILMKGSGNLAWHARGGNDNSIDVSRDNTVLSFFTGLTEGTDGDKVGREDENKGITLKPLGYYYNLK